MENAQMEKSTAMDTVGTPTTTRNVTGNVSLQETTALTPARLEISH